ncbi:MAG TPA: 30S ribosomal protein S20 [Bacteroidia bacterium]|jgi:small subunit ribosomal protein S20
MANHKSAEKRIRANDAKRQRNRYQAKTVRTAIKKLRENTAKGEAAKELPKLNSMLDKLAKRNIIHKNKAANLKSKLAKHVSGLK